MVDNHAEQWSIPVGHYPGPVCRYTVTDGTPVVRGVDRTFEQEFGAVRTGTAVTTVFESLNIAAESDEIARALVTGDSVSVTVSDPGVGTSTRQYLVQPVPPENGEAGLLLFTEWDGDSKSDGALGVDHVASVVSHDLRNPLDVAKTRLRAGRELGEDEHFDHVERAHERMERIIEDVLTLARGEDVVEPDETVDLGAIAERAWETVETRDATLSVEDPLPTTVADPDRVGRLFENLFRNAIEHGTEDTQSVSELTVTVSRINKGSADGFSIADDGVGIPESEHERVFEPGYSSDDHGTGLGLAIVAQIAALHGWESVVTTAGGGGTRVEVHGVDPAEES